ncbi:DUF898 family protein [Ramlibacter sp. AN1133]|uniref:DUF898 family protein n=1 Tax=Ramlibacter sp. AN1133 TaxID=3133429 RepID=UPI0030BB2AA7
MRPLPLTFTGGPDDLRRHTRRDLLINIVLGGLYTPIARRHTNEYLAAHTTLDGTPLVHVDLPHSRWPAILLVLAFVALRVANEFGAGPPLPLVIVCGVLLLPYLWGTVTMRAVGAVRWRQLQPWFTPRWKEIYLQSWPLLLLGAAWAIAQPRVAAIAPAPGAIDLRWLAALAAAAIVAFPLLARQSFNWRRLRLTHTRVAGVPITWDAPFARYLRLWFLAALAVLVTAVAPVLLLRQALFGSLADLPETQAALVYLAAILLAFLLSVPARAWYEAEVFHLTWDGLRVDDRLRVECGLDVRAFVLTRTAGAWRTFITFGLHHPRAVVAAYQARLAALRVWAA